MKNKLFVFLTFALLLSPFVGLLALIVWPATGDDNWQELPSFEEENYA